MATAYVTHTDNKIPARVFRPSESGGERQTLCDLTVERFMGVLVHPVPAAETEERTGTFHPGGKIFTYWPQDETEWYSYLIMPGDQLEVEGRTLTICAVEDYPHCYSEIYVDES